MRGLKAILFGWLVMVAGPAFAHTTEVPHAHPHIMDLSVGSSVLAVALFAMSVVALIAARRATVRRRK